MKLWESPDKAIRPTKAIVRKSLFQRLEPWTGRSVCDLYAGIGTLGIEALSRGAAHVTFVENDRQAFSVLERNVAKVHGEDHSTLVRGEVNEFLAMADEFFDVVLADPPYRSMGWEDLQPLVAEALAPGGSFVMELARSAQLPEEVDVRSYGKTKVGLWRKTV